MVQTSREMVRRCLTFESPERMPRELWVLPWAISRYPEIVRTINERYPGDVTVAPSVYKPSSRVQGDPYAIGTYVDEWGCEFQNLQEGVVGEVKEPPVTEIENLDACQPPYETLPDDWDAARDEVNRFCAGTDLFVRACACPRPWERMQFLRGTVNAMMDMAMPEMGAKALLKKIHDFYMKEMEFWASTDVDALMFMDDWGSQQHLLISPKTWRDIFKPLYKDYCNLARAHGKFIFMHSDGNISQIYEDLVEIGVSAVNSQLFVMDMEDLARRVKGKITFWGEIDRQHVLPSKDPQVVRDAVQTVARHLYDPRGGIFVQFEFGPGAHAPNALLIFEEWDQVQAEMRGKGAE